MRLAVVNAFFPPRAGGSAHLSEAVARLAASAGHEVLVLTSSFQGAAPEERSDNYRVVRLPSFAPSSRLAFNYDIPFTSSPRNLRRVFRLLDEFRPDVVHQHGQFFDITFSSSVWAKRRRVPRVLTVHTRLISPSKLHGALMAVGDLAVVRPFTRLGDPWVVPVDSGVKGYVLGRYGIPPERVVDIPVGIEAERFGEVDRDEIRKRLGIGDRPMILSLGHVIPLRDRLALVRAMPMMLAARPDLVVVVVGHVYDERFVDEARRLGVEGSLVVTGAVPKDEVPLYAAAADVEAHDLQGFGLGTASLEMLAAGVPVVTDSPADAYPTARIVDGEHVVLARPDDPADVADAFLRVLDDPELRARLSRGGPRLIEEKFSMQAVTREYFRLYERALREAP